MIAITSAVSVTRPPNEVDAEGNQTESPVTISFIRGIDYGKSEERVSFLFSNHSEAAAFAEEVKKSLDAQLAYLA